MKAILFSFLLPSLSLACGPLQPPPTPPVAPPGPCNTYGPSSSNPTSVSQLRPGDIGILATLGDSDPAAFGARATNLLGMTSEDRDISFASGTSSDTESQTSLTNMLLQYNPNLVGGSPGSNSVIFPGDGSSQGLNLAVSGAWANNVPAQVDSVVAAIKNVPGWKDSWKMVLVALGGNDICVASCGAGGAEYEGDATPEGWKKNFKTALKTLKKQLPKTLVVVTSPYDVTKVADITNKPFTCQLIFGVFCPCYSESTRDSMVELRDQYKAKLVEIADEMRSDQFGVEVIPGWENLYPEAASGGPDISFLAPDCYHFNTKLHSMVGKNIWNNLIQDPAGRTSNFDSDLSLICPNNGQFLSTTN